MAEGPRDALVSIEKSLQSTNNLDIHPRSSQLLLLNGRTEYHFRFGIICMILRLAVLIQYRSTTAALIYFMHQVIKLWKKTIMSDVC